MLILVSRWERRLREADQTDAMECKDVVKMTNIEGLCWSEGGTRVANLKLTRC